MRNTVEILFGGKEKPVAFEIWKRNKFFFGYN